MEDEEKTMKALQLAILFLILVALWDINSNIKDHRSMMCDIRNELHEFNSVFRSVHSMGFQGFQR